MSDLRKIGKDELDEILQLHGMWLRGEDGGKCAALRRANLSEADLDGANLSGADLRRAIIPYSSLRRASLSEADLEGADLRRADLSSADLRRTNLNEADLDGANLSNAHLNRAIILYSNLGGGTLHRADLSGAIGCADFSNADLSRADLSSADLGCSDLSYANLQDVKWNEYTILHLAKLIGAKLPPDFPVPGAEPSPLISAPPSPTSEWERKFGKAHAAVIKRLELGTEAAKKKMRGKLVFFREFAEMKPLNLSKYARDHRWGDSGPRLASYHHCQLQEMVGEILTQDIPGSLGNDLELSEAGNALVEWIDAHPEYFPGESLGSQT